MKLHRVTAGKYTCGIAYIEHDAMTRTWLVYHDSSGIPSLAFPTLRDCRAYFRTLIINQQELAA